MGNVTIIEGTYHLYYVFINSWLGGLNCQLLSRAPKDHTEQKAIRLVLDTLPTQMKA